MARIVPWAKKSHAFLAKDALLGAVAIAHGPPTIEIPEGMFELLVRSIVGQQLTGKAAETIYSRFKKLVGTVTPRRILKHDEPELRTVGLSGNKARTILGLARPALEGLNLEKVDHLSDDEIKEALVKIKGIGPWTAEMFLIFGLGRPDVFSAGDLGLRKGLKIVYQLEELPEPKECPELFEPWRPYRSAASWYLWRAIENRP